MSTPEIVLRFVASGVVGYLLGSIPSGVLVGKIFGNIDPRKSGSGKTGATNVLRTLGPGPAAIVVLMDVGKGAAAVLVARFLFFGGASPNVQGTAEAIAGLAALLGHNFSIFINFSGGRGVLTGAGGMLMMSPVASLVALISGIVPIALTRYVSLGSITAAAAAPIADLVLVLTNHDSAPHLVYLALGGAFVIFSHKDNIQRLLAGTERKLGQPATGTRHAAR